jgi:electron transport complex protein RnfC
MKHFFGGVHPHDGKELTRHIPIENLPVPAQLVVPLSMHIGANAKPTVKLGDNVKLGEQIGELSGAMSSAVHSPVSGTITAIEERLHPSGRMILAVVIDNDGLDTPHETVKPRIIDKSDYARSIVTIMKDAGVVGMGGAAFPSHFKLTGGIGKADTLIINGAECEPYITSDHRMLLEHTDEVLSGIRHIANALKLKKAYLAVEANKDDAISLLRDKINDEPKIEIVSLPTRFPQGSEKQLIQAITKRQVPPGKLPADVGCVVFNVYTAWSVDRAIRTGIPVIDRVVTVSGPGIVYPKNLRVRMGTPVQNVLDAAGGLKDDVKKVLLGGPMMGNAIYDLSVPVIKGTNSITALLPENVKRLHEICIRCGKCVAACPMRLQPVYMYQYERKGDLDALRRLNISDCMECGSCAYSCPGRLSLVQAFRSGKAKIREADAKK